MVETVKFRGKAKVVGVGIGFRMEIVSEDNSIPWSGDDVGQSFDVTIKRVAPNPDAIIERVMCKLADRGIVPKPAPEPPSWDNAPEWAQWLAQDGADETGHPNDDAWWWHKATPRLCSDHPIWGSPGRQRLAGRGIPNHNWRSTLQQRPKPEPLCPVCGKPASKHEYRLFCCPFCGRKDYAQVRRDGAKLYVYCTGCGAHGRHDTTGAKARGDWNRRA